MMSIVRALWVGISLRFLLKQLRPLDNNRQLYSKINLIIYLQRYSDESVSNIDILQIQFNFNTSHAVQFHQNKNTMYKFNL